MIRLPSLQCATCCFSHLIHLRLSAIVSLLRARQSYLLVLISDAIALPICVVIGRIMLMTHYDVLSLLT